MDRIEALRRGLQEVHEILLRHERPQMARIFAAIGTASATLGADTLAAEAQDDAQTADAIESLQFMPDNWVDAFERGAGQ